VLGLLIGCLQIRLAIMSRRLADRHASALDKSDPTKYQ
jgi:hypothetical protein